MQTGLAVRPQILLEQQQLNFYREAVQDQFNLAAEANQAQEEGAQRVVDTIESLREEMRNNYAAMAERLASQEIKIDRLEQEKLIMSETHRNELQQNSNLVAQLTLRLDEASAKLSTLEGNYYKHVHRKDTGSRIVVAHTPREHEPPERKGKLVTKVGLPIYGEVTGPPTYDNLPEYDSCSIQ